MDTLRAKSMPQMGEILQMRSHRDPAMHFILGGTYYWVRFKSVFMMTA